MADAEPIVSGAAGRYATALFELARDAGNIEAVAADLARFDAAITGNPDLLRLVRSPVFSADEQSRAIDAVMVELGIGGFAANLIRVVIANRRLFAIHQVVRAFSALVARHRGEMTAQVTVAEPLGQRHLGTLRDALRSVTSKDVRIDVKVDPEIIGGLVVKLGSRMIDTSLRTKLNSIRQAMKEVG